MTKEITIWYDLSTKRWLVKGTGEFDISLVDFLDGLNVREIKVILEVKDD